jgi:hypothetical protein
MDDQNRSLIQRIHFVCLLQWMFGGKLNTHGELLKVLSLDEKYNSLSKL